MRMKHIMVSHVTHNCQTMFRNATNVVQNQLEHLLARIHDFIKAQLREIHAQLTRDYLAVLVGTDALSKGLRPPRVELMLRSEMAPMLARADEAFAEVFLNPSEEEAADDDESSSGESASEPSSTSGTVSVKSEPGTTAY
jgi:hypothetical protein